MKKGNLVGIILAVLIVIAGSFILLSQKYSNKGVNTNKNSKEVLTKIEDSINAVQAYFAEINITGAVGNKRGSYLIKQWYKDGKLYTENFFNKSKTSVSLREKSQTTTYDLNTKTATITTSNENNINSQDSNFLQYPLDLIKNNTNNKISQSDKEITISTEQDQYQYQLTFSKDNYLPQKIEAKFAGKFLFTINYNKIELNPTIKEGQIKINLPPKTKIFKRSYSNETSDLTKIRTQVKFPVLIPAFLPKGVELDKVTKETFDKVDIVNLSYKGLQEINVIETTVNKDNQAAIPNVKKVKVGKYQGYITKNDKNLYLSWNQNKTNITVYGQIDEKTLLQIAVSFK